MKSFIGVGIFLAVVLAFWSGMKFQEMRYDDICLDMGGGRNPGNHPICIVEGAVAK
ncbi:MAG: hypothetical protein QHC90_02990 [Shinella sp.]|nr:hypothetical protein [Shinella sp.]